MQLLPPWLAAAHEFLCAADPRGFEGSSGAVHIVRGSHLYCDPDVAAAVRPEPRATRGSGAAEDRRMEAAWLHGRPHPVTGAPMRCEEVRLPPGSLVAINTHCAHKVGATDASGKRRLAMSLFASKADDTAQAVLPPYTVPPLWALKTLRGELPSSLAEFFRNGVDRSLTGGEDGSGDPDDALFRA